ncbi:MAG: type II secretion system F family protein [Gammaproteobacteria bacterium]|nr:type II secretion system F family protein [Gammaproteobacteria bacterium]
MTEYQYRARARHGEIQEGVMEAGSPGIVAARLQDNGLIPIRIDTLEGAQRTGVNIARLFKNKVSDVDLIQFSRQMASLSKAGVPILGALRGLKETTENPTLADAIGEIGLSLESGRELAVAMAAHPEIFSPFYVSMIRIGETTGKLEEVLFHLVRYLERDRQTRNQIRAALRYPSFVVIAIIAAIAIINLFVIPTFAQVFHKFGADLPLETRFLVICSNFTVAYWPELLFIALAGFAGARYALTKPRHLLAWDRFKLRIPFAGRIIHRATLARFARMFAMATQAGVPLFQTLTVVPKALDNAWLESQTSAMREALERGDSITRAAKRSGVFNPLVLQMIAVGEETGSIDTLLNEVAEFYEDEVEQDIKRLSDRIEPLLLIVIACVVLILALGVFLPMWNLAEVAIKK